MLVAHSMGSHGGQQNFPFGYLPNELHGIGLPEFMTPGPPPGQPLLSEHDTQNLDSFLNGFDNGGEQSKDAMMQQYQNNMGSGHEWMMPPTFVGSETSLRTRNGAEWQNYPMTDFSFSSDMNMSAMAQSSDFHNNMHGQGNGHSHSFAANGHYDHNLLNQLHSAAQTIQPSFAPGWQPGYQPQSHSQVQQAPRPTMKFGSDSDFQPSGYTPADGQFNHTATPSLDWLEAQSSAANTQPNTEPNTQPSSPNWPKKRKLEDYQADNRRNGFNMSSNGHSARPQLTPTSSTSNTRTFFGQEQLPTPISRHMTGIQQDEEHAIDDEDADYDDDEPGAQIRSGSLSSNSRTKVTKVAAKPSRARKKSTASNTPNKSKAKTRRGSTSGTPTSRTPLTADQKKANHTNSEQRRRDATARAYAELYDLVPELEELGKQSTMKKLEVVVSKVQRVKERVQQLRAMLGFDVETGAPLQHDTQMLSNSRMGGGTQSNTQTWQQ